MEQTWKCNACGYGIRDEKPPEKCPACGETCTFVDNTDYTQNIGNKRPEDRL